MLLGERRKKKERSNDVYVVNTGRRRRGEGEGLGDGCRMECALLCAGKSPVLPCCSRLKKRSPPVTEIGIFFFFFFFNEGLRVASRALPSRSSIWLALEKKKSQERSVYLHIFYFEYRVFGMPRLASKVSSEQNMQICAGRLEPWDH